MIINATLNSIQRRTGIDPTSQPIYGTSEAMAIGCCVDEISNSQKWTLGAAIKDCTECMYLEKIALGSIAAPGLGDHVTRTMDGETSIEMEVVSRKDRVHGADTSHWEIYLKRIL